MLRPDPIPDETLRKLHHRAVTRAPAIRRLLERAQRANIVFSAGVSQRSLRKTARVLAVGASDVRLETTGFSADVGRQLAFNFELEDSRYFCVMRVLQALADRIATVSLPPALYLMEQRELYRAPAAVVPRAPTKVELATPNAAAIVGEVFDWTYHGIGVDVPVRHLGNTGERVRLGYLDGADVGDKSWGDIRHQAPHKSRVGWTRVGLSTSHVVSNELLPIHRIRINRKARANPESPRLAVAKDLPPAKRRIVDLENDRGELIRGVIDCWGDQASATAVVIPPAWGRTKETLLPLAATIVESFRSNQEPIVVMRFDGTRRRGESYVPSECRSEGAEHLKFTFSQAVEDTSAAVKYLRNSDDYQCRKVVLITFSLAAVEGRRVVARDEGSDIAGWISVVGVADLQSALHVISGGVDFGYGLLRGVRFGKQELFGVLVDIDHAGLDAIDNRLSFLEDARRDMAKIDVPVTWLCGRFDGWVDFARVRALLSCGNKAARKLYELSTGHQLRSSREALETFQLVTREVAQISLGRPIDTVSPESVSLSRRSRGERQRLRRVDTRLRPFWREYLLGREAKLGIELLTATESYRTFMCKQRKLLDLQEGQRVADLGAGTGEFYLQLVADSEVPQGMRVHAVDFVAEALERGMTSFAALKSNGRVCVSPVVADLDCTQRTRGVPFASRSFDAVLASLLVSYVSNPIALLNEIRRILRPGGTLVISSLRQDADISKIYADSVVDRYSDRPKKAFGDGGAAAVDRSLPEFLNSASRIIELEERGEFRFFDQEELADLVGSCGFSRVTAFRGFGDPPQAVVVRGSRR